MIHILNATGGSEDINNIKYVGKPSDKEAKWIKKATPLVSVDWKELLPPPPSNTSDVTKTDLEQVQRITRNISKEDFDMVMLVDDEPSHVFMPYLKRHNLSYPQELIDLVLDNVYPVWLKLKYYHKRPRPFQIAPHLGYIISVIQTSTHQTPAYPSGHQAEGAIIAEILSDIYPEHQTAFYEAAGKVGHARLLQGVHYPSDNEASMILSRILWENIKGNLDDNWTDIIKK
tara:strand:- start:1146 stop:1835 length:690 start_codon:yes stop_codon:yes gene_type:complete